MVKVMDTIPPVINLMGDNPFLITNANRIFTDPGASATDSGLGSIAVVTNSTVNLNYPGVYTITYAATDIGSNDVTKTRAVAVALPRVPSADLNGDGVVNQIGLRGVMTNMNGTGILSDSDWNLVYSNYWASSTNHITDLKSMGQGQFTFGLTNDLGLNFKIYVSSNLTDWAELTNDSSAFLFNDDAATNVSRRYYRLHWP